MADQGLSKSAKQRLAKKARDDKAAADAKAAAAAAAPPPAPAPAPAAAKAKAKAAAAGYPDAKAAAKPAAAPKTAAKTAAPAASNDGWTEATAKSKSKKGGSAKSPALAPAPPPAEPEFGVEYDDGTGGDWEMTTSSMKKKERQSEKAKQAAAQKAQEQQAENDKAKQAEIEKARAAKKAAKNGSAAAENEKEAKQGEGDWNKDGWKDWNKDGWKEDWKDDWNKDKDGWKDWNNWKEEKKTFSPAIQEKIAAAKKEAAEAAAKAAAAAADKASASRAAARAKEAAAAAADDEAAAAKPQEPDNCITLTMQVPEEKVGQVIGPKGAKVRFIQEKTGVVSIDTKGTTFTIRGEPEKVPDAEKAIKDLMNKGYTELSYENFQEASVMVNSARVPDLIGKGGELIRTIKNKCNVEINIPKTPAGAPKGKAQKIKVDIAGSADGVTKCKEIISSIVMFYHHELTHPCATHAELDVPEWANPLLIGKGGAELKHIQSNFVVKVYIPREGESDNKNAVIVGGSDDVKKAKAYMEKKIKDAEADWSDGKKAKDGQ